MSNNLANLSQKEKDKINVDLIAASVACKERYKMSVIVDTVEHEQPETLRSWFRKRLVHHRQTSRNLFYHLNKKGRDSNTPIR